MNWMNFSNQGWCFCLPPNSAAQLTKHKKQSPHILPPLISTRTDFVIGSPKKMGKRKEKEKWGKRMGITQYVKKKDKVWQVNNEVEITHMGTKYI